ncbi:MAG: hypothetical protein IJ124_10585 [Clostridia bacterium]|nr:hypothetical protein [Clostridia bacterium]
MPDTKFSLRALCGHIRRYFWIYLAGIAVCLVLTSLLWTTTRPQIPNEQNVIVFLADGYSNYAPLEGVAQDMLLRTQAFDETLKKVEFQNLQYTGEDYAGMMLLMTRLAVGEGDAFLASQSAMDQLARSQALEPLDEYVAAGWLGEYNLAPYYVTLEDEETGQSSTFLAGLSLDTVNALSEMGAFANQGAYLCVTGNGGNLETTMKALEYMMEDLTEGAYAGTEASEPAA